MKNYDKNLFAGAVPNPTPFVGYSSVAATAPVAGSTLYDSANDVTFAMISQTGTYNNVWTASGSNTLTIPIGIFGVQNVWTMLNNYYGNPDVNDTSVTFKFDNNADGSDADSLTTLTVDLKNGVEIRSAVDCTANCTNNYATSLATGSSGTVVTGPDIHCTGPNCLAAITVLANNLFSASGLSAGSSTVYAGETITTVLDDQGFLFGNTFANQYLVSIGITEKAFSTSNPSGSATAISAISLQTFPSTETPEPSSLLLGLSGLVVFTFVAYRRRQID